MKYIKYLLLIIFICFSFYFTEKIVSFTQSVQSLYKVIESNKEKYALKEVDGIVDEGYLIPGIIGLEVNVKESYYNMQDIKKFESSYLLYNYIYPNNLIKDNMDKIIIKGNNMRSNVSIIADSVDIMDYLVNKKININSSNVDHYNKNVFYINDGNKDFEYKNNILKSKNINNSICLLNDNYDICKKNKKIIIKYSVLINNSNYFSSINEIENGSIIYISNNTSINYIESLINYLAKLDLKIVFINELISEK